MLLPISQQLKILSQFPIFLLLLKAFIRWNLIPDFLKISNTIYGTLHQKWTTQSNLNDYFLWNFTTMREGGRASAKLLLKIREWQNICKLIWRNGGKCYWKWNKLTKCYRRWRNDVPFTRFWRPLYMQQEPYIIYVPLSKVLLLV